MAENTKHLFLSGFKDGATPRSLFIKNPRLSLNTAFARASQDLPANAAVIFKTWDDQISTDIFPFCGPELALKDDPEPTHLHYQYFPAFGSVLIRRIKVTGQISSSDAALRNSRGIGTAMIASQYPLWQELNVTSVAVSAHHMSEGFYRKLGFENAARLPERPNDTGTVLTPMRLDLKNGQQKGLFLHAMGKVRPLMSFNLDL